MYIKWIDNTGNGKKVNVSSPNKEDPINFRITVSPVANKTGRTSPGPNSSSLLVQIDIPSNNSFLWVTESHTPIPALDSTAHGEIAKGPIGGDILK